MVWSGHFGGQGGRGGSLYETSKSGREIDELDTNLYQNLFTISYVSSCLRACVRASRDWWWVASEVCCVGVRLAFDERYMGPVAGLGAAQPGSSRGERAALAIFVRLLQSTASRQT